MLVRFSLACRSWSPAIILALPWLRQDNFCLCSSFLATKRPLKASERPGFRGIFVLWFLAAMRLRPPAPTTIASELSQYCSSPLPLASCSSTASSGASKPTPIMMTSALFYIYFFNDFCHFFSCVEGSITMSISHYLISSNKLFSMQMQNILTTKMKRKKVKIDYFIVRMILYVSDLKELILRIINVP
jgi:hypothetical protein